MRIYVFHIKITELFYAQIHRSSFCRQIIVNSQCFLHIPQLFFMTPLDSPDLILFVPILKTHYRLQFTLKIRTTSPAGGDAETTLRARSTAVSARVRGKPSASAFS